MICIVPGGIQHGLIAYSIEQSRSYEIFFNGYSCHLSPNSKIISYLAWHKAPTTILEQLSPLNLVQQNQNVSYLINWFYWKMFHGITGRSNLHYTRYDADPKIKIWWEMTFHTMWIISYLAWCKGPTTIFEQLSPLNLVQQKQIVSYLAWCKFLNAYDINWFNGTMFHRIKVRSNLHRTRYDADPKKKLMKNDIPQNMNNGMWIWIWLFWRICVTSVTSYPVTQPKVRGQCGHAYVG